MFCQLIYVDLDVYSPEVQQLATENWWLEDKPFLLGLGNFSGANC